MPAHPGQSCSCTPRFWYSVQAASISSRVNSAIASPSSCGSVARPRPGDTVSGMDAVDVEVAGRVVTVTSPDKVMFPEHGQTKLDLVDYYRSVEHELLGA